MKLSKPLIFILLIAAILRFYALDTNPPGIFGDEVDLGYHAYSLFNSAKDTTGHLLPFYIRSFAEWKAPAMMYFTAPFVGFFGLNAYALRTPSVIAGLVAIYLIYKLADIFFHNKNAAMFSALFMAISPWHIHYSRGAWEANLLLTLSLLGLYFAILGHKFPAKRKPYWSGAVISFSLTFYTYSTANVFIPLLAIGLLLCWKKQILARSNIKLVLLGLILLAPFVYHLFFGFASERYNSHSLFNNEEILREISRKREFSSDSPFSSLIYNRPVEWTRSFLVNYTSAFSPRFLFQDADLTLRHSVNGVGEFYWIQLPLILIGIYALFKFPRHKYTWLLFVWMIASPIPSSLTKDGTFHTTRLLLFLPSLVWISGYGASKLRNLIKKDTLKKIAPALVIGILAVETLFYLHNYFYLYPKESWRWWHYGYKEAFNFTKTIDSQYDKVFINNTYEPALLRYIFYYQIDPNQFRENYNGDEMTGDITPHYNGFKYADKYFFGTPANRDDGSTYLVSDIIQEGELYMLSYRDEVPGDWDWETDPPANIKVLHTVNNPLGDPIFYIVVKK